VDASKVRGSGTGVIRAAVTALALPMLVPWFQPCARGSCVIQALCAAFNNPNGVNYKDGGLW